MLCLYEKKRLPGEIRWEGLKRVILRVSNVSSCGGERGAEELELRFMLNYAEVSGSPDARESHCAAEVRRSVAVGEEFDVVCDVSAASRRLLRPGRIVSVSVIAAGGEVIDWKAMGLTVHCDV